MKLKFQTSHLVKPTLVAALLCAAALAVASSSSLGIASSPSLGIASSSSLGIASSSSGGIGNSRPEQFGRAIQQIMTRPDDGGTVALVDSIAISQRQLDIEITARQFAGKPTDRTVALQSLVSQRLVLAEATRQGIRVSDGELNAFVVSQREIADPDPERRFYGYAAGLGLTETSIWSYQPLLEAWRRHLLVGKLTKAVLGEVTQETVGVKEAQWATYVDGLREKAQVVVK